MVLLTLITTPPTLVLSIWCKHASTALSHNIGRSHGLERASSGSSASERSSRSGHSIQPTYAPPRSELVSSWFTGTSIQ